jgi:CRP-like cAMP-binding protein
MAGWTAIGGQRHSPYRAVIRHSDGRLLKIPVTSLLGASASNPNLRSLLAQYVVVTAVQMAEGLGAHSHHRLEASIARWLLMRHDRVGGDWISAQHQEIAEGIGARRASVTDCLHILEGEQHVRCRRGRILIRSRHDLEAKASGAYGAAESLYRASLGHFGKSRLS